jgi:hypothetical protein
LVARSWALSLDAARARALELDHSPDHVQASPVLLPTERPEHSCEVARRRDRRPDALAERFTSRGAAEIVVAVRAFGLADNLEFAGEAKLRKVWGE